MGRIRSRYEQLIRLQESERITAEIRTIETASNPMPPEDTEIHLPQGLVSDALGNTSLLGSGKAPEARPPYNTGTSAQENNPDQSNDEG